MDPAEQLQQLYTAGFDLQTFERFPKAIGVQRGGQKVFVHKQDTLEATPERIATLERFKNDLKAILHGPVT